MVKRKTNKEYNISGTNLFITGFGKDVNGNSIVKVRKLNGRAVSIQTNNQGLFALYNAGKEGMDFFDTASHNKIAEVEQELVNYVVQYGKPSLKGDDNNDA